MSGSCLSSGWKPGLHVSGYSAALVLGTNPAGCVDAKEGR